MKLGITNHAVQRYQERVKPALSLGIARQELEVLVESAGQPTTEQPDWHLKAEPCSEYLPISDGIVGLVKGDAVVSVIVRSEQAPEVRQSKRQHKATLRAARIKKSSKRGDRSRGRRPEAPAWD